MSAANPIIKEYKQLLQGAQTYASHVQVTNLRNQIDRILSSLRRAAGAQDLYQCFGEYLTYQGQYIQADLVLHSTTSRNYNWYVRRMT